MYSTDNVQSVLGTGNESRKPKNPFMLLTFSWGWGEMDKVK